MSRGKNRFVGTVVWLLWAAVSFCTPGFAETFTIKGTAKTVTYKGTAATLSFTVAGGLPKGQVVVGSTPTRLTSNIEALRHPA